MSYAPCAPPTNQLIEEHKSPPCKKRRTLDISDVSCLVATGQKAAFLSPQRTILSKSSDPQPSRKPPSINQGVDVLSQELIEEDTMIQSSLPQYFNHIFGGCVGCSKLSHYKEEKPTSLCNAAFQASDGSVNSDSPVIEESQGFTVRGLLEGAVNLSTGAESESTAHITNNSSPTNLELSPLLFHSPISPPKSPSNADNTCAQTNSEAVPFPRPLQVQNLKTYSISHIDNPTALPTSLPSAAVSQTYRVTISSNKDKSTRKRRWSSSKTPRKKSKCQYTCPPSCVTLMDCTSMKAESTVSILAIVLQGMYIYVHETQRLNQTH